MKKSNDAKRVEKEAREALANKIRRDKDMTPQEVYTSEDGQALSMMDAVQGIEGAREWVLDTLAKRGFTVLSHGSVGKSIIVQLDSAQRDDKLADTLTRELGQANRQYVGIKVVVRWQSL